MNNIDKAFEFACEKHKNQEYGDFPYYIHLMDVMKTCRTMQLTEDHLIVAALHDVLEDTGTTSEEIFSLFGEEIENAVVAITKTKKESYREYIMRVKKNSLAKAVKTCDVLNNLEHSIEDIRYSHLVSKYEKALFWLSL